ncbi:MAG: hypothetical protein QM820_20910 [Minicystis sp.]
MSSNAILYTPMRSDQSPGCMAMAGVFGISVAAARGRGTLRFGLVKGPGKPAV